MKNNHHEYFCDIERSIWQEENKVKWIKPALVALAIAVPLFTMLALIWVALP
jgi:hypothetical protein